ncbi:MATE family efflux transporter [Psychrobacter sp. YP14]|uniref:Multidrug-efflux transporter n=3 Tax=Psychrobacter TaxID=497 RepID=A0A844LZQ1_9GAMM|nr:MULTISPECIES: MATE family efflux transporter [Psychrobacter]AWT49399.1 MATE family efflux transporter [Psychrobacter sp. YP14]MUG32189.1 MATE family efflux transporter [Psychrobacter sanguinis]UNK04777.1 MATE family efflux transporter [Psychrobacter sp. PraFG1]
MLSNLSFSEFKQHSLRLGTLVLPILITQFCQAALGVVDALMAGGVSALDLAAVSIGSGIWLPLFLLATGTLIATTPLIGEKMGEKLPHHVPHITQQSLWAALFIGAIGLVVVSFTPNILGPMGVPADIQPKAAQYLRFVAWGFPAIACYAVLRSYCEALGRPEPVTIISLIGLFINIPINYIFIHGLFGMPELGGAGCGLATACVLWINVILLSIYLFFSKHTTFDETRFFYNFAKPDRQQIGKLFRLGVPIGISIFFEASLFSLASIVISPLGAVAVASHQVALAVTSQLFMIPMSVAMGLTIMVSNRYGEKNWLALQQVQRTGLIWTVGIALVSMLGVWLFRENLADAFTDNPAVKAQAMYLLLFAIAYQLVDGWQVNIAGILRGMQDTQVPMWITLFCYWLVALPLGTYLVRYTDTGAQGFWMALVTGLSLSSVLLTLRLIYRQRQVLSIPAR